MIQTQDEFNKAVSRSLRSLYSVAVLSPHTIAAGDEDAEAIAQRDDASFRSDLAGIDAFAFRAEYAVMPKPDLAPLAD